LLFLGLVGLLEYLMTLNQLQNLRSDKRKIVPW